jgi:hypothetical protein
MNNPTLHLCIGIVLSISTVYGDSFEPVEGYFSSYTYKHEYSNNIRNILLKDITDKPLAQLLTAETVMLIQPKNHKDHSTGFEFVLIRPKEQLWNSPDPDAVDIERFSAPISKELAHAFNDLWFTALGKTAYPLRNTLTSTGASFHYFSVFRLGEGIRAAKTTSPSKDSIPRQLISLFTKLQHLIPVADDIALPDGITLSEYEQSRTQIIEELLPKIIELKEKITKDEQVAPCNH